MFRIKTEKYELKLEVVPVDCLLPHEATLPHLVDNLILEFKNWSNLQDPIIVDENHIILDGNHRANAFKKLKIRYILACKIDYLNKNLNLKYWFRLLENVQSLDIIKQVIEVLGGTLQPVPDREVLMETLECNRLCCGIQQGNLYALVRFKEEIVSDPVRAYDILEKIQKELIRKGVMLNYIPCQYVHKRDFCDELKSDQVVIWTPQITKEMVTAAAKERKTYAPKTTRHLIPARPINVNIPTRWFNENISLENINRRVSRFLNNKGFKRFGPGQIVNGRHYEEEIIVFYDKKRGDG